MLPLVGFYFGSRYQKREDIDPKLLKANHPFEDHTSGISIDFPKNWPVLYLDNKLLAITQYTPYPVVIAPNISKAEYEVSYLGEKLGKTTDGGEIYRDSEGYSGPQRYMVVYPDKTAYLWYFMSDSLSGPPSDWTDGIWSGEVNYSEEDTIGIIKSSSRLKK